MTNESLQKEIEAWRQKRQQASKDASFDTYGPDDITPKLVAEIEFLNRVVDDLHDERAAAAAVLRLERENARLLKALQTIDDVTMLAAGGPIQGYAAVKRITTEALENVR